MAESKAIQRSHSHTGYPREGLPLCPRLFQPFLKKALEERSQLRLSLGDFSEDAWRRFPHFKCQALAGIFLEIIQKSISAKKNNPLRSCRLLENVSLNRLSARPMSTRTRNILAHLETLESPPSEVTLGQLLEMKNVGVRSLVELVLIVEDAGEAIRPDEGATEEAVAEGGIMEEGEIVLAEPVLEPDTAAVPEIALEAEAVIEGVVPEEEAVVGEVVPEEEAVVGEVAPVEETAVGEIVPEEEAVIEEVAPEEEVAVGEVVPEEEAVVNEVAPEVEVAVGEVAAEEETVVEAIVPKEDTVSTLEAETVLEPEPIPGTKADAMSVEAVIWEDTPAEVSWEDQRRNEFLRLVQILKVRLKRDAIEVSDVRFGTSIRLLELPRLNVEELSALQNRPGVVRQDTLMGLRRIFSRFGEMDMHSLTGEIRDIVLCSSGTSNRERDCTMYLDFHGWSGKPRKTLSAIGGEHGTTRERVRQIIASMDAVLARSTVYSPRLRRLSRALGRLPARESTVRVRCRRSDFDLSGFTMQAIRILMLKMKFPAFDFHSARGMSPLLIRTGDQARTRSIIKRAEKSVKDTGLVSITAIREALDSGGKALDGGKALEDRDVREVLSARNDCEWMQQSHRYCTLRRIHFGPFLSRFQKMLSAVWCIDSRVLLDLVFEPDPGSRSDLPLKIHQTYIEQTPGLLLLPEGMVIVDHYVFGDHLSEKERFVVEFMHRNQGIARRVEISAECDAHGMSRDVIDPILIHSPAVCHLAKGFYGLPGTSLRGEKPCWRS